MPKGASEFFFPKSYTYPPLWNIQPICATRERQFQRWSGIILAYCRHSRIWRLRPVEMLDTPLFHNKKLRKWLSLQDVRDIIDWMTREEGLRRAEWVGTSSDRSVAYIYWRRPEEWAEIMSNWVRRCELFAVSYSSCPVGRGNRTEEHGLHTIRADSRGIYHVSRFSRRLLNRWDLD